MREVILQRDTQGLMFSCKAMIMSGMALNTNGIWEEIQLSQKLQEIIKKHRNHFNVEVVLDNETQQQIFH